MKPSVCLIGIFARAKARWKVRIKSKWEMYRMTFEYPEGRLQQTEPAMASLLGKESLVVKKKSNKGKCAHIHRYT